MSLLQTELREIFALDDWLSVGIDVALALAAAMAVYHIVRRAFAAQWFAHSALGLVLRRIEPSLQSILPVTAIVVLLQLASDALPHVAGARRFAIVGLITTLTFGLTGVAAAAGDWIVGRHPYNVADNLAARRVLTGTRVVVRTINTLIVVVGLALALVTFPAVRQFGTSLLASAGVAGLILGLAARSVLGNILAGLQIAVTQPIRLDDVLIVNGEWGRVEEITGTYVVIAIWDKRRLIVPLQWFIENPFQNWTRTTADIIGQVPLWLDYRMPLEPLRAELKRICEGAPEWDRQVCVLQVTDASDHAMQVRVLASAADSGKSWDLTCRIREGLIGFVQRHHPECLPRFRGEMGAPDGAKLPQAATADRSRVPKASH